jgi:hypothetical protein
MAKTKKTLFPRTVEAQVADLNTKIHYLKPNGARLGISAPETALLEAQINALNAAHVTARDRERRSRFDVAVRNSAILTAQTSMRRIIDFHVVGNPDATEVDFEALSIPRRGPHPHLPLPTAAPGIGRIASIDLIVRVPFFEARTGRRGKPAGVQAIEAFFRLGGEPPTDVDDLTAHVQATASPLRIPFDPAHTNELLHIVFRWVGTRGDFGPWSQIHTAVITR